MHRLCACGHLGGPPTATDGRGAGWERRTSASSVHEFSIVHIVHPDARRIGIRYIRIPEFERNNYRRIPNSSVTVKIRIGRSGLRSEFGAFGPAKKRKRRAVCARGSFAYFAPPSLSYIDHLSYWVQCSVVVKRHVLCWSLGAACCRRNSPRPPVLHRDCKVRLHHGLHASN